MKSVPGPLLSPSWLVVAVLLILAPACRALAAHADCGISLKDVRKVDVSGSLGYDIYSPTEMTQTVFFGVFHSKNAPPCDYFVTFSKGQAGTYDRAMIGPGIDGLSYQIYDNPSKINVLKDIPEAFASEVLSGTFDSIAELQQQSWYLAVPPMQVVVSGRYEDSIQLSLYEGSIDNHVLRDTATATISTTVGEVVELCITECGAPFDPFSRSRTMSFGNLVTGANRAVDLQVRGTVDYEVIVGSDNAGTMLHTLDKRSAVPYALTINGTSIDLGRNTVTIATGVGPTGMEGDRYEMRATIGEVAGALAGDYSDVINITVRSK